jgi:transcription elongation factor GreA
MIENYLSRKGREKLIEELEELQKRKLLVQEEISRAREFGDLRENSEYHAAKETLANLLNRVVRLKFKISSAKIIEEQNIDSDKVFIGATAVIRDDNGNDHEYTIVDLEEADPVINKISVQSPLAQGLLGHKIGDNCEVELPYGKVNFKIIRISR